MLSSKYRIPSQQFPRVTRGTVAQNELFRVVFHYDNALDYARCAVVVSQKIAKTSVARNATRRMIYALLGELYENLPTAYISVFPKKSLYKTDLDYQEIKQKLAEVCLKK